MADEAVTIDEPTAGGSTREIATDTVAGVDYPLIVPAFGLDGAAKKHASDTDPFPTYERFKTAAGPKRVTVAATATRLDASPLASRRLVRVVNIGTADVYVGHANTVTTSGATTGFWIRPGGQWSDRLAEGIEVWGIVASGTQDVIVVEYA